MRRTAILALIVLAGLIAAPIGWASSFSVVPVRVILTPGGKPEVLRLRSESPAAILLQVEAVEWSEDVDAAAKATEILAVPPVFTLEPEGEQVVRLALRESVEVLSEKAYRLLITEVPQETGTENTLSFALRLNLPVFVTPKGASPVISWDVRKNADGLLELTAYNQGTAHLQVSELTMAGTSVAERATYILAGESKSWPLDRPLSALPETLEVRAKTNRGPLVAEVRPHAR